MTNLPPSAASLRGAIDLSSLVNPPKTPAAPPAGAAPGVIVTATDATFSTILDISSTVPVIVEFYGGAAEPVLGATIAKYAGRLVLATVDGTSNPQLAQAFQVTEVPTVAAVIAGRPLQLFVGMPSDAELGPVFDQVLQLAAQQGVTGTIPIDGAEVPADAEPVEEPLPPHHQEAYDAIAEGDYATAIKEYETAIAQNPRDQLAVAGLAQVSLLSRLAALSADETRATAAAAPTELAPQLAVADLDVSGGHLEDAFLRLLDIFPTLDAEGKLAVRLRLVDYFEIAGSDDPRVIAARRRLTTLLY